MAIAPLNVNFCQSSRPPLSDLLGHVSPSMETSARDSTVESTSKDRDNFVKLSFVVLSVEAERGGLQHLSEFPCDFDLLARFNVPCAIESFLPSISCLLLDEISTKMTPAAIHLKTNDQIRPATGPGLSTALSSNSGHHHRRTAHSVKRNSRTI